MTREEIQKSSLQLIENNRNIALKWSTSLGKSRAAIEMMNWLIEKKSTLNVLILVAETAHKNNWKNEFHKWNLNPKIKYTIECYNSLKKYDNTMWDVLILDEVHHIYTEKRIDVLRTINSKYVIALSATFKDDILCTLNDLFGTFTVSNISFKKAIDWNILPEPKVYVIPLTLNNTKQDCSIIEEWGKDHLRKEIKCSFEERWKYLKNKESLPNVKLIISCTQQQKYNYLCEQFEYWKNRYFQSNIVYMKNKWLRAGSERKIFLGELKTPIVYPLIQKLKNRRFICFCTSILQAEALGGNNAIHSKMRNPLKTLNEFNEGLKNSIFCVGMLQEGQNLNNIQIGIIVQLDGQERVFIQKFGRSMRADSPIQCIFYYKNTRDEEYLKKALESIDDKYIEEINDINKLKI